MAARAQLAPDKACLVAKLTPRKSATCFPSPPAPKTLSPSALGGDSLGADQRTASPLPQDYYFSQLTPALRLWTVGGGGLWGAILPTDLL